MVIEIVQLPVSSEQLRGAIRTTVLRYEFDDTAFDVMEVEYSFPQEPNS
ncbi:MAG: hypothetical protein R3E72_06405 [Steroidobacteraceae bacterium]